MKKVPLSLLIIFLIHFSTWSQPRLINVKSKKFKTSKGLKIVGDIGYLEVAENRNDPNSRRIRVKYVHLKSLAASPGTPVVYLEGGGGTSTWEVNSPIDLASRIDLLQVSDLVFLDRRGATDESLVYIWKKDYPSDFFLSEAAANQHYQNMASAALEKFAANKVDVTGYQIEEHARDVDELMNALGFDRYNLYGFSYGSHIGMTVMKLFPDRVERAILAGADATNQAFNYPRYLDEHVKKIGQLVAADSVLSTQIPDFRTLVASTMERLEKSPAIVTVKNPLTRKEMNLSIGAFGLALVLRLDIDDANDIPAIPRLLHTINQGDYSMLTWFVQKRLKLTLGFPGQGINQQLASGASDTRWSTIEQEASQSLFGNAVNFPFSAVKDYWIDNDLSFDPSIPLKTSIPTLFISGTLDCRTPVDQVEKMLVGFEDATHVIVDNAGHEQAMWAYLVNDEIIPAFLKGRPITQIRTRTKKIRFLPLEGPTDGHPSTSQ